LGVATYPEDGETGDALTHAADQALYRAKRSGGNTVCE
jgi:GGDEF domain-containing protein